MSTNARTTGSSSAILARQLSVTSRAVHWRVRRSAINSIAVNLCSAFDVFWVVMGISRRCTALRLAQILLGVQRQLQQALEKLILRNADEVLEHQLLGEQPADVTQLQHLVSRCVDEIAVTVVDDDEVALRVEARTPQLARRLVVGVAGQSLVGRIA